jgi:hypothetical protein
MPLEWLVKVGYSTKEIAVSMGVSRTTVWRLKKEMCLLPRVLIQLTQQVNELELYFIVSEIYINSGCLFGAGMVKGMLTNLGYRVGVHRIKNILRVIDPAGSALRKHKVIKRRVYKVAGPLSLIHIDGYHKLIRWKIVIHGGIDGYSRFITFWKLVEIIEAKRFSTFLNEVFVSTV